MAESRSSPKPCVRSARRRPVPRRVSRPSYGRRAWYQHVGDRALALESDLSCDMAVQDQELDAIARLLGDALDAILPGTRTS
jgi:hypothetical protein